MVSVRPAGGAKPSEGRWGAGGTGVRQPRTSHGRTSSCQVTKQRVPPPRLPTPSPALYFNGGEVHVTLQWHLARSLRRADTPFSTSGSLHHPRRRRPAPALTPQPAHPCSLSSAPSLRTCALPISGIPRPGPRAPGLVHLAHTRGCPHCCVCPNPPP